MTGVGARHDLFYDTETALRLVDGEVRAMTGDVRAEEATSSGLAALRLVRARVNAELQTVLGSLRDGRAALESLEATTLARPQHTREELADALQFHDATTRQLAHAAAVLAEIEGRLVVVADSFDPESFDPGASTRGAGRTRAVAGRVAAGPR